jgi:hypothetical protein
VTFLLAFRGRNRDAKLNFILAGEFLQTNFSKFFEHLFAVHLVLLQEKLHFLDQLWSTSLFHISSLLDRYLRKFWTWELLETELVSLKGPLYRKGSGGMYTPGHLAMRVLLSRVKSACSLLMLM